MVLSKRERYIGYVTAAVMGIVMVYYFIVAPLWERKTQLDSRIAEAKSQRDRDNSLLETSERAGKYWTQMSSRNLPRDGYDADQMLNNLSDWAQDAGLSLSSVKSERTEKEKDFYKKTFRAAGSGEMRQIGQFLYRIQTASTAARITDLTLSSRKEGADDLSVSVGVATIYPVPENEKTRPTASIAEVSR